MALPTADPLITGLATGQTESYAILYDRLGPPLFRVARTMLHSSAEAEDAVQDVFVELVRHRDRLAQVRDLNAYLFVMLRNNVRRRLQSMRKEAARLPILLPNESPPTDLGLPDELERALKSLPTEQREVIAFKVDAGLTFAQIAEILEISPNTAASRYRYAIEKLRDFLERLK